MDFPEGGDRRFDVGRCQNVCICHDRLEAAGELWGTQGRISNMYFIFILFLLCSVIWISCLIQHRSGIVLRQQWIHFCKWSSSKARTSNHLVILKRPRKWLYLSSRRHSVCEKWRAEHGDTQHMCDESGCTHLLGNESCTLSSLVGSQVSAIIIYHSSSEAMLFCFYFLRVVNFFFAITSFEHPAGRFCLGTRNIVGSHILRQRLVYWAWVDLADLGAQPPSRSTSGFIEGQMGGWVSFRAKQQTSSPAGPSFWGFDASIRA